MDNRAIWEMPSGGWVQDNDSKRFFILNSKSGEIENNQLGLDIIAGARWHSASESDCGGFFPPEFTHCPFCGTQLVVGENHSDVWVPPFGNGSGLRLVAKRINVACISKKGDRPNQWLDQDKDIFPLPRPRGDYEFIVAPLGTKSPVLVTFDRTTGLLDYFSPAGLDEKKWIPFTLSCPGRRIGESKLPNWSWSAALVSGKAGFAVPTDEGPVWIDLDWRNGSCTPETGSGECIGGAAILENQAFIPVIVEGALAIHSFDFAAFKWKQIGEPVPDGVRESGEDRYFSVPIVDAGRRIIYWVGITSLLTFDLTNHSLLLRPWETDAFPCRAVPELGPPYQDSFGNFWQICYDDYAESQQERAFRYYKLNGDESDREDVDGGRFSSGVSCFSKPYDLWEQPWAKMDKRQEQAKSIRAPLLCLDEESKVTITANFGFGSISPLLEIVKGRDKKYQTLLRIESPNDLPIELRMLKAYNIHTPWELRLFIYQQYLFVYSIEEAICYKWRLK